MTDLSKFVSSSPRKTPPMIVKVYDGGDKAIREFEAPAGFQVDRYVHSLYPEDDLMVSANHKDITVSVFEKGTDKMLWMYVGTWKRDIFRILH